MADACLPQLQAVAIRVTDLEENGRTVSGATAMVVSDAFTEITWNPNIETGDEITDKNAAGGVCVSFKAPDSIKWWDFGLTLCAVDPYLETKLGQGKLNDPDGGGVSPPGWSAPSIGTIAGNGVSIEVWTRRINNGDMDLDYPYAWWVFPKITQLIPGDRTIGAANQNPTFTGRSVENPNWFDGPLNDYPGATDRAAQWVPTTTLPTIQCGYSTALAS